MIPLVGEASSLASALIWAVSITLYRKFGQHLSAVSINVFKSVLALFLLGGVLLITGEGMPGDASILIAFAVSGVVGITVGDTMFFGALKRLGAQTTAATQCLSPVLTAGIAYLVLQEELGFVELCGLILTTGAVCGVVWFSERGRTPAVGQADILSRDVWIGFAMAVLSALCQAGGIIIASSAYRSTSVMVGTFVRLLAATGCLLVLFPHHLQRSSWRSFRSNSSNITAIIAAALMGTFIGLLLMGVGVKYAKAGVASALNSTYPVWIVPIAAYVLHEKVEWRSVFCTILAVLGVVLIFYGR